MDNPAHCLSESQLAGYLAGNLPDADRMSVERHAGRCVSCRIRLVDRFEHQRERAIVSPTPEGVAERGLALLSLPPTIPLREGSRPSREVEVPGSKGLKWAIILILLAALVALFLVFVPDPIAFFRSFIG